jgi:hypothetical protein
MQTTAFLSASDNDVPLWNCDMQVRFIAITAVIITTIITIIIVVTIIMIIITDNTIIIFIAYTITIISFIAPARISCSFCTSTGWHPPSSLLTTVVAIVTEP